MLSNVGDCTVPKRVEAQHIATSQIYAKITNDKIKRDMKNSQARNRQQLPDGGVNRKPMLLARFYSNE